MKAIEYTKYGPPDVLHITEVAKPEPADDQVLIRIIATTVTAVDSIFRSGKQFFARLATGIVKPKNKILGTEFSGEIVAVGKKVKNFQIGDKVYGDSTEIASTHAEYISLNANGPISHVPAKVDYLQAATLPYSTLTALPFLRDHAKLKPGQRILIIGASGSVGTAAVQLAKHYGAHVTAVCSAANAELVKSLGADEVIDYTQQYFTKSGQTWDVVFDTVGKSSYKKCKPVLTPAGVFLTTFISFSILWNMLLTANSKGKKAVIAFTGMRPANERANDLRMITEMVNAGKIRPVVDKVYPFEQFKDAYQYVDRGHKKGNVVIKISPNGKM